MAIGYLLFFYSAWLGYEELKSRILDPRKIFIMPLIFVALSIWSLFTGMQGIADVFLWAAFLLMGYVIGWKLSLRVKVRADRQKHLMGLPGSPFALILVLVFFGVKLLSNYVPEVHSRVLGALSLMITSAITGIFVGHILGITKKFAKAKHEKLRKK